jgi:hypothetical protein
MMMGPEPMIRTERIEVSLGMSRLLGAFAKKQIAQN